MRRIAQLVACNAAIVAENCPGKLNPWLCLIVGGSSETMKGGELVTFLAFKHLHEFMTGACLNFLHRMKRHRYVAVFAWWSNRLDSFVHCALPFVFAGGSTSIPA